jgi:hypothetical protein
LVNASISRLTIPPLLLVNRSACSSSAATVSTALSKLMTEPFSCLGFATDDGQEGERPMAIRRRLEQLIPAAWRAGHGGVRGRQTGKRPATGP